MFIQFPEAHVQIQGLDGVRIPEMVKVKQLYHSDRIEDPAAFIRRAIENGVADKSRYAGKSICITVGSRGIPRLDEMVREMCLVLKEWGGKALPHTGDGEPWRRHCRRATGDAGRLQHYGRIHWRSDQVLHGSPAIRHPGGRPSLL